MNEYEDLIAEYERLKREKIGPLERAGDWFSGFDERLDFLVPRSLEALVKSREALTQIGGIRDAIAQLPGGEAIVPMKIEQIPYSYTLAIAGTVGSGIRLTELAPFSGHIKWVMIHWPDGCNALVDVAVGHSNIQFCPREGYLALNDASPIYIFNEWVDEGEEIWVEMLNGDAVKTHGISVTVSIEGVA